MVNSSETISIPPERVMIALAMRSPNPVRVAVPTTIPTVPQAQATPRAPLAPESKASMSLGMVTLVSLFRKDTTRVAIMP